MNDNLLIVGAGDYGIVAFEIAQEIGCFDKIDFVDDNYESKGKHGRVVGTTQQLTELSTQYSNIVVAIGNSRTREELLKRIEDETPYNIVSLISPRAYVSPSAQIKRGCIVEPMAVIHNSCEVGVGCIISAGAVINHTSVLEDVVHVDCNATVQGYTRVPTGVKVLSGQVYSK